jgi:hypothetical protein
MTNCGGKSNSDNFDSMESSFASRAFSTVSAFPIKIHDGSGNSSAAMIAKKTSRFLVNSNLANQH